MKAPARITTERLVLRRPALADAEEIFRRYASDAEVTRFLSWPRHESVDETLAFLQLSDELWREHPVGPYLIESHTKDLLGGTGLDMDGPHRAVTGYVLARAAWRHGYATEALRAMIDLAGKLGVSELSAICHTEHLASQRVLEKCGFMREEELISRFPNYTGGTDCPALRYVLAIPEL